MESITANVNWLAVIIGAVLAYVLGWLWYSPMLFGKQWAAAIGVDLGTSANMPVAAMIVQAIWTLLLAWVVGVVFGSFWLLVLIVVAVIALVYSAGMFGKKGAAATHIEAGFIVAMAVIMYAVQLIM